MLVKMTLLMLIFISCFFTALSNAEDNKPLSTFVSSNDVQWGYLNPLRGNKSPDAAELWGDRTKNVPTGMLVRFKKGFSSPPHIHNITYRGIVIKGMMHNDDPSAPSMWMPTGSFWTQPAGDNHITAANGQENLIYLEIESGPYLVKPSTEHFDNGEVALNLHESNLVWLNESALRNINVDDVQVTSLWTSPNNDNLAGSMVELPVAFKGTIKVNANEFRAVVIKGNVNYQSSETKLLTQLPAASYFSSIGEFQHNISSIKEKATIYIRTNGEYKITAE